MMTLGSYLKYYLFLLLTLTFVSVDRFAISWNEASYSDLGEVVVVNNYTEGIPCSELRNCLYTICQISKISYANVVSITINDGTCRSPSYVSLSPVTYTYYILVALEVIFTLSIFTYLLPSDTLKSLDNKPSERKLRIIRILCGYLFLQYVAILGINIYYSLAHAKNDTSVTSTFSYVTSTIAIMLMIAMTIYSGYNVTKKINFMLDPYEEAWNLINEDE